MTKERIDRLFDATRLYKKSLSVIIDIVLIILSLYLAYLIRLGSIDARYINQIFFIAAIIVPFKILAFWIFRLYHITFRYISLGEVISIIKASALSSPMIAFIAILFRDWIIFSGFPPICYLYRLFPNLLFHYRNTGLLSPLLFAF